MSRVSFKYPVILPLILTISSQALAGDTEWYVRRATGSQNMGPYGQAEVRSRLKDGSLKADDYAWSKSTKKWIQLSESEFFSRSRMPASESGPPPFPGDEKQIEQVPYQMQPEQAPEQLQPEVSASKPTKKNSVYVKAIIGPAFPVSGATGGPYFSIGGELGLHAGNGDIGLFGTTFSNSSTSTSTTTSASVTSLLLSVTSQGGIGYFGGRIGMGIRDVSTSSGSLSLTASGSSFAVGPVAGIRVPLEGSLEANVSLSVEVMWLSVFSGSISGSLGSATLDSIGYLIPLAGFRANF